MAKSKKQYIIFEKIIRIVPIFSFNCRCILGMRSNDAMLFTLGKAGGLQILRYQGLAVADYGFALGCLAPKPSGFRNDRV